MAWKKELYRKEIITVFCETYSREQMKFYLEEYKNTETTTKTKPKQKTS